MIATELLWWHWVVAGLMLMALELVVPSFLIIWFGVAGVAIRIGTSASAHASIAAVVSVAGAKTNRCESSRNGWRWVSLSRPLTTTAPFSSPMRCPGVVR